MARDWIKVTCPNCGAVGRASRVGARIAVRCPQCQAVLRMVEDDLHRRFETIDKKGRRIDLPSVHRANVGAEEGEEFDSGLGLLEEPAGAASDRPPPSPDVARAYAEATESAPAREVRPAPTPRLEGAADLNALLERPARKRPAEGPPKEEMHAAPRDELFKAHDAFEKKARAILQSKVVWVCAALLAAGAVWRYWPRTETTADPELHERVRLFLKELCAPAEGKADLRPFVLAGDIEEFRRWFSTNSPAGLLGQDAASTYEATVRKVQTNVYGQLVIAGVEVVIVRQRPDHPPAQTRVDLIWKKVDDKWYFDPLWTKRTTRPN